MNNNLVNLLIDEIAKNVKEKANVLQTKVFASEKVEMKMVSTIFSMLKDSFDEYVDHKRLTILIDRVLENNNITEENIVKVAVSFDSKVRSVQQLREKIVQGILSNTNKFNDRLVFKCVEEIKRDTKPLDLVSPSKIVKQLNEYRTYTKLNQVTENKLAGLFDNYLIDEDRKCDIFKYDSPFCFENTVKVFKNSFGVKLSLGDETSFEKKNMTISKDLYESSVENGTGPALAAMKAIYLLVANRNEMTMEEFVSENGNLRTKYQLQTPETKLLLSNNFTTLSNLLISLDVARTILPGVAFKQMEKIALYYISQSLVTFAKHYDEPDFIAYLGDYVKVEILDYYSSMKLNKERVITINEQSGVKFEDKDHIKTIKDSVLSKQQFGITNDHYFIENYEETKPFNYKNLMSKEIYKKRYDQYKVELENFGKNQFIKFAKIDVDLLVKKLDVAVEVINSQKSQIEQMNKITISQLKDVVDTYAFLSCAKDHLAEVKKEYVKTDTEEQVKVNEVDDQEKHEVAAPVVKKSAKPANAPTQTEQSAEPTPTQPAESTPAQDEKAPQVVEVKEEPVIEQNETNVESQEEVKEEPVVEVPVHNTPVQPQVAIQSQGFDYSIPAPAPKIEPRYESIFGTDLDILEKQGKELFETALRSAIAAMAQKDIKTISDKLKFTKEQDIKLYSMLFASLNMLVNMPQADKSVRNMFISLNKANMAKDLINLKENLFNYFVPLFNKRVCKTAYDMRMNTELKGEELLKQAFINMNCKFITTLENNRKAEIDMLNFTCELDSFEYQDEADKINAKYYGDEEVIGLIPQAKRNMFINVFKDVIIDEIRDILRFDKENKKYSFDTRKVSEVIDNLFEQEVEENEQVQ